VPERKSARRFAGLSMSGMLARLAERIPNHAAISPSARKRVARSIEPDQEMRDDRAPGECHCITEKVFLPPAAATLSSWIG
jgi:hypothetical protein